jgi:serine protease Do
MPSPTKSRNVSLYFLLAILGLCLGAVTLAAGLGAGRAAAEHFTVQREMPPPPQTDIAVTEAEPETVTYIIDYAGVDFSDAIESVRHSVVSITVFNQAGMMGIDPYMVSGSGSGFIFYQDENYAYVATNSHVVEGAISIIVSLDDEIEIPARRIGYNREKDLAVLSVSLAALEESGLPFGVAALGCSDSLRMGDFVVAMGNALGEGQRTTQGIISALDLNIQVPNPAGGNLTLEVFQTDAAVNRGNSGGPLINEYGEVVGIITAKFIGVGVEGMGYVLPIENVREMLEYLRETGSIVIPYMGISHNHVTEALRELYNLPATGQWITRVVPGSPAHEAGLLRGDLITHFAGRQITSFYIFREALIASSVGETIILSIIRNGESMEIEITLGEPRH